MFSTFERLKRRTPAQGISRPEFIEHLVEEFHITTDIEAQEQVTANLANFAYDPINWKYLIDAEALDLFLELVALPNQRLQLHGLAGLCNICLCPPAYKIITSATNINKLIKFFLQNKNLDIVISCVTLFYQLLNSNSSLELKAAIATTDVLKQVTHWKQNANDARLINICKILLEDFGTRNETIELVNPILKNVAATHTKTTKPSI